MDPSASSAARLGAEIRAFRQRRGLTLLQLACEIGFSTGHVSAVELAAAPASEQFVVTCDGALGAGGALLELLPAAVYERASERHRNAGRRRWGGELPMPQRARAPAPVQGIGRIGQRAPLNLSSDAPLAALVRERCRGVRLSCPTPDFGIDWILMLPRSASTFALSGVDGRARVRAG